MKHKKAFLLEFFIRFVIALVFIGSAFYIGSKLFRLSDKGYDDYNRLIELIKEVEDREIRSIALSMNKNTAIVAFSRNDDQSVSRYQFSALAGQVILIFERSIFPKCTKDKSCVCLVTKPEFEKYENIDATTISAGIPGAPSTIIYTSRQIYYEPEEGSTVHCEEIENIDLNFECNVINLPNDGFRCSQGFILERNMVEQVENYERLFDSSRTRAIYLTKRTIGGKSLVGLCLKSECEIRLEYDIANEFFGSQDYQEALQKYLTFIEKYNKGSEVELSILRIGNIYKDILNNSEKAKEYYEKLINDFPNSQYIEDAKSQLNEIKTKKFDEANELYSQHKFNAALASYLSFVEEYDGGIEVETALMRIAFIYKEQLNIPSKAIEFYTKLIEEFPESQFRESAESALQTLETG